MKKLLLTIATIFAAVSVVNVQADCGCPRVKKERVCAKACPHKARPCAKRCERPTRCKSCAPSKCGCLLSRNNENNAVADEQVNEDLDILGRVADTTDAAVTGAVNTADDVATSAVGSREASQSRREARQQRREERAQARQERRADRQDRRAARYSAAE